MEKKRRKGYEKQPILNEIIDLRYNKSYSTQSLLKHLLEKYGYKQARSYELIREAKAQIATAYDETTLDVLKEAISSLESLQEEARKEKDYKLVFNIQQELNKIQQLHIQKLEIDANMNIEVPLFGPTKKEKDE